MAEMTRRSFVKAAGTLAAGAMLPGVAGLAAGCGGNASNGGKENEAGTASAQEANGMKAKVYYSKTIDADALAKIYAKVNSGITGKTAIKLHSGEPHGPNILPPALVEAFQKSSVPNSTLIEANTAYGGARASTERHRETMATNGWSAPFDIIDAEGDTDLPVNGGFHLKKVAVGSHLLDYDSMLVLTHFKGHAMGGFGGSLKNIAIGCASGKEGKLEVHGVKDYGKWVTGALFMELMADSGKAILDHFGQHITYINVLRRMSVDCDCAGTGAAEPTIPDLGILASTDILAVDQASVDMVYHMSDPHKKDLIERIESREGLRQLTAMQELGMGTKEYEIVEV